jgi:hypothetical protein
VALPPSSSLADNIWIFVFGTNMLAIFALSWYNERAIIKVNSLLGLE